MRLCMLLIRWPVTKGIKKRFFFFLKCIRLSFFFLSLINAVTLMLVIEQNIFMNISNTVMPEIIF